MSLPKNMTGLAGIKDFVAWRRAVERYLSSLDNRIAAKGDSGGGSFMMRTAEIPASSLQVGTGVIWLGPDTPDGWLPAGSAVDPDTYPDLYALTGDTLPPMAAPAGVWIIRALP